MNSNITPPNEVVQPKAFISHATEDKNRFVRTFAERLRANGVRAWLDEWELKPGDSLVERIFEEGIGGADVFIVVLSALTAESRWVREELNAGVVSKISGRCKLIPVVLDNAPVPEALRSTVYQKIDDINDFDTELDRILRAIFDAPDQGSVGPPPGYVTQRSIAGLNHSDTKVLSAASELAIRGGYRFVDTDELLRVCEEMELTTEAVVECFFALEHHGFVEEGRVIGTGRDARIISLILSWAGLRAFLTATRDELATLERRAVATVVNAPTEWTNLEEIAAATGVETLVAETLLVPYEQQGLLTIIRLIDGHSDVGGASPLLKRVLG